MKIFDEEEKKIIKKVTQGSGYSRSFTNILDVDLDNTRVRVDKENKKAEFLFEIQSQEPTEEEIQWGIKKQKQLVELLIKYLTLLRYLEKEELAVFFEPAKSTDKVITFGKGADNRDSFSMEIYDQNIVDHLIKYIHKEIMPTPSLMNLENNKFLSDEEIRFDKQHLATWGAISVSVLLGLYGMYNNHQNSINQEEQFKKQIEGNKKAVEVISGKLDKIVNSRIDYSVAITDVSKELSKLSDNVNMVPKHQVIEVKLSSDEKK